MLIAGVDEAGRGPIIGPMVMACFALDEKKLKKLDELDVKDSKLIPKNKREGLYDELIKIADKHKIISVEPRKIDNALRHPFSNLNKLEVKTTAELLNHLQPNKAILDCPVVATHKYEGQVMKKLKYKPELVVENKADLNHKIVGAASILAKVTRDRHLEEIKSKFGVECGSGYLTDPATIEFLEKEWNNKEYKGIFRESWSTFKNFKQQKAQSRLGDY